METQKKRNAARLAGSLGGFQPPIRALFTIIYRKNRKIWRLEAAKTAGWKPAIQLPNSFLESLESLRSLKDFVI